MLVTAGQRHASTQLGSLLDAIRVPRPGPGRPRKRPAHLVADCGYSYPTAAGGCASGGSPTSFPSGLSSSRPGPSGTHGVGRPPRVDPAHLRQRNVVERAIARLKQHRAIATQYDTQSMMAALRIGSLV
jgi:transposase